MCACTSDGALHFFVTTDEEDSVEEKEDPEDVTMLTTEESSNKITDPSTSMSSVFQYGYRPVEDTKYCGVLYKMLRFFFSRDQLIAHKLSLSCSDLRLLYELTRFDRNSPAYGATVPPCWNEMIQAQRQRLHPQHLHQSEEQHHTRTWRLHNEWYSR